MSQRALVQEFVAAYRAAFEALDVPAIADLFAYPCQITRDAGEIAVTAVPTRQAWVPQIERLVAGYRTIGVRSAEVVALEVAELTPRLAQASMRWRLSDAEGRAIYEFDASYTLARLAESTRITAIAHNELPRLRAAMERLR